MTNDDRNKCALALTRKFSSISMKTKLNVYVNMNQDSIVDKSSMELRVIFQVLFHGDANRRRRYTTKYYFLIVENEEVGKSKIVTLDLDKKSQRLIK